MKSRDFEYVSNRLSYPVGEVGDALERLKRAGYHDEHDALMRAMQRFVDDCRVVRRAVNVRHQTGESVIGLLNEGVDPATGQLRLRPTVTKVRDA